MQSLSSCNEYNRSAMQELADENNSNHKNDDDAEDDELQAR